MSPAYLREIHPVKCAACGKPATVTVYNGQNALIGSYCTPCGRARVKHLQEQEAQ